jgi:hypothetical protein
MALYKGFVCVASAFIFVSNSCSVCLIGYSEMKKNRRRPESCTGFAFMFGWRFAARK